MARELARQRAAHAWCTPETEHIEMDVILGEAFADILEEECSKPRLGCATTREILEELTARTEVNGQLDYKTIDR